MAKNQPIIEPPQHLQPAQVAHWEALAQNIPHDRLKTRAQLYLLELATRHAASIDFLNETIVMMEKQTGIITDKDWWQRYREAIQVRSQESKALTATLSQLMTSGGWDSSPIKQSKWSN